MVSGQYLIEIKGFEDMENYRSIWTALFRTPHRLDFVDVGGVNTRYLEAGRKDMPPLLLLHGTAGSLENFSSNIAALAEHFHVYAIDMLGCGWTEKPDFDYLIPDYAEHAMRFLDTVGIQSVRIIGVSLGSWVGARMATLQPERVSKLLMVAPAGIITDPEEEARVAAAVKAGRLNAAESPTWESVSKILERMVHDPSTLMPDIVAVRLAIYSAPQMKAAMPHLLAFPGSGGDLKPEEWEAMQTPLLTIASIDAGDMFMRNAYAIAEIAPNATLVEMKACDHWPQFEQPEQFNNVAIDFLK